MAQEEIQREKEARKEGLRKRKPVFTAKEKTDEELKGYSQLNMELTKGEGVKAVTTKVINEYYIFDINIGNSVVSY